MKRVMISIVEVDEHVWIHATLSVVTAYVIVKKIEEEADKIADMCGYRQSKGIRRDIDAK